MLYEISNDGAVEKEVVITIPKDDLNRSIDVRLNELQKDLALKGFRKGKVPKDIIRARYYDTIKVEALNDLVNESFWKVLQERAWFPASRAELKDMKEGDSMVFTLQFEIVPEFNVEQYKDIELFKEKPLPDELLLEQAMKYLKDQFATVQEITRPAAVDDIVTMDMTVSQGDTNEQLTKDVTMKIGDRSFPDEVNRVLVGAKKTDEKKAVVNTKTYTLHIKKIEERTVPVIDDAFARSHSLKDLEELKKKLLADAQTYEKQRLEEELKEKLSRILLERTQFPPPKSMVTLEYQKMLQRMNADDNDANRERFWATAENRARLNLILDWIARRESITVNDEEVKHLTTAMRIKADKENKSNIESYIKAMVIREKTLDYVFKHARISEKSRILSPKEAQNDTHSVRH
ncbi:trigger factor [candidate division WOR-3 bacterium]|nr:trigger factor [candidate division WOR-3 bacterium]